MKTTYLRMLCAVQILMLAGCSGFFKEPPGITYAKSVEELGITAVYPPREDLQVGDIYAIETHTVADRMTAKNVYVNSVDLSADIETYLDSRYKFKNSDRAAGGTQPALGVNQVDALVADQKLPTYTDLQTLPIRGFPEIEVNSGISIGVSGQPQGLMAALGFTAAKTLKMRLRFGGVTSYEIPIPVGMRELDRFCRDPNYSETCRNENLARWINQKYQMAKGDDGYTTAANPLLVTKVYLARQITYTFNDASLAAAVARSVAENGAMAAPAPGISQEALNEVVKGKDADLILAMSQLITSLNTSTGQVTEGSGSLSLAVVNQTSVSFNEVFDRPVAIGYEGVSFVANP